MKRFSLTPAHPLALALFLLLSFASPLHAQVGNNNPTGASGIFNGQINTGCSYDPYTGNATRSITDIVVAGAVGEYPLALGRTANSRTPSTTEVFGFAGGWNHNYNWILEDSPVGPIHPTRYTVDFPDGRVETFRAVTWDTANYYRVRPGADTPAQTTTAGLRERFIPLDTTPSNMHAYLILPDGGKIEFKAQQHVNGSYYSYTYHVTAIYDPYGLKTTIDSELVANNTRRRITKVTEPAGRYLQFSYATTSGPRISQVTEGINGVTRRTVQYSYSSTMLDHVVYYSNPNWTARYQYVGANVSGPDLPPLLWTADDPMYAGPMKRIAYEYKPATPRNPDNSTPVYGQILRERYYDGATVGVAVSTLTVGSPNNNSAYRTETRGDGATRTFVYNGTGQVTWASDFMGQQSTMGYDSYKYLNSFIDCNRNQTDYTSNALTGNVTVVTYPFTHGDTPNQQTRPTVRYQYGWAGCPDPNNQDANNPYYLYSITDEGGHSTIFTRDANKRVYQITYPDGGYERFTYNGFGQVLTHRMTTGGTEAFAYDGFSRLQYYSDPYHNNANNPSVQYYYDGLDRVSGAVDVPLNHATNWDYNDRGQITGTTLPWYNGTRYTITNAYNPNDDGTLISRTDELGHVTSYTYDDYRRVKSVTAPARGDSSGTHTTSFFYDANGTGNDYRYTDSNVTYVTLPSGKKAKTVYDDDRRQSSVTVAPNTADETITNYGYDAVGNVTRVINPLNHAITTVYDERNRPSSVTFGIQTTTFTYDTFGRKKTVTRPNGQVITYASFDNMNRVLQQNVDQTPDPLAVTKYTYYPSGLLYTMQDPHLSSGNDKYTYVYDLMGRKQSVSYPLDGNVHRTEQWSYDTAGRLYQFTNRNGKVQTFSYDQLNRMSRSDWNDSTPDVAFGYDAASRLIEVDNANAHVSRRYFNDNLLHTETQDATQIGGVVRTVNYAYDDDGNRASIQYPDNYAFAYTYTERNQLKSNGWATYDYNAGGNLTTRTLNNGTYTTYTYDPYERVTWVTHYGIGRTINYGYDDMSNNCLWALRGINPRSGEDHRGEVFSYDLNDQVTAVKLDILNPNTTSAGPPTIVYDANGNRTSFRPYGTNETYAAANNLGQYTSRIIANNTYNASYDTKGNLLTSPDPTASKLTCTYDAQNRLTSAGKNGTTMYFTYDGLNRQVSRTTTGQPTTFNVWDGWDLIEEYQSAGNGATTAAYLYGAGGLIIGAINGQLNYYYQDGSGSTSHIADANGVLQEWYRYDLQGTPFFYGRNDNRLQTTASPLGVRHLFTGQQWYGQLGLYDLRNRFYSPDIGRFLQPDPIEFRGGNNLYRYCRNNPVTTWDPFGLQNWGSGFKQDLSGIPTASNFPNGVNVNGNPIERLWAPGGFSPGGFIPSMGSDNPAGNRNFYNPFPRPAEDDQPSVQHPAPSSVPPQNPQPQPIDPSHPATTAEFIIAGNMIEHGNTMDTNPAFDPISLASGAFAARAALTVVARAAAGEGTQVFRVFGNEAKGLGHYYTAVNPGTVANYRQAAGLFRGNSGQFVLEGTLKNTESVIFTEAAPGPGGIGGGLPEVFVPNPETQISILRVSGANPDF